ncbi:MAG TPA: alpha/beta hydrolase family protein [Mycobacteriales bacterium]|nr:alpha/beta hydrolase family protein [Mycobacteriales bacterium]
MRRAAMSLTLCAALGCGVLPAAASGTAAQAAAGKPAGARVIAEKRLGPRVIELTITTPAFNTPTHVDVDLPVGYRAHPDKRWPVAYFLAGILNNYASFNDVVDGLELTRTFPAISVSPNGDSGWWSDWYEKGKYGAPKYETFVIDQLIPLIDRMFRTIPTRSQRAIAGVSMGGYGAMMLAARHPDLFGDAASISGAVDTNFVPIAEILTASSLIMGRQPDAIYGPQATQEVRWRGHNPTTLASNLRGVNLQLRTADGTPNQHLGETLLGIDATACVEEAGVHQASVGMRRRLNALGIHYLWHDYGPGCHDVPNFEREIGPTLQTIAREFAHPSPAPATFSYRSIEPAFEVYGWRVRADRRRALEFLDLNHVSRTGLTLTGSGTTTVTTPPLFHGVDRVVLHGATTKTAAPDSRGRITFQVDLGAPDTRQEYTVGADTTRTTRTVRFGRASR